MRENRMNSLGKSVTAYSYALVALKRFLAEGSKHVNGLKLQFNKD